MSGIGRVRSWAPNRSPGSPSSPTFVADQPVARFTLAHAVVWR